MPGLPHESKVSGREASARNTYPQAEGKIDGSEYGGSEHAVREEDLVQSDEGDDPRELGFSEKDLAEADNHILDNLNQDFSRAEELGWLLEGKPLRHAHLQLAAIVARRELR